MSGQRPGRNPGASLPKASRAAMSRAPGTVPLPGAEWVVSDLRAPETNAIDGKWPTRRLAIRRERAAGSRKGGGRWLERRGGGGGSEEGEVVAVDGFGEFDGGRGLRSACSGRGLPLRRGGNDPSGGRAICEFEPLEDAGGFFRGKGEGKRLAGEGGMWWSRDT